MFNAAATFNPAAGATFNPGAATSFKPAGSSAAFVPKGKFTPVAATVTVKKNPEDPCYGKPKEFFIYEFDQASNTCICLPDQLTFIAINYVEHYNAPIEILIWLYDMAEYKEGTEEQKRFDALYAKNKIGKAQSAPVQKSKAKKEEEYEVDYEEESTFGNTYKGAAKKKPAAAPTLPVFGGKAMSDD